ncbi:MAG TPA: hypothetical protein VK666_24485 [Chryseolinea sp.]|nr:hypothetical protein [Chryseolinea sp.]
MKWRLLMVMLPLGTLVLLLACEREKTILGPLYNIDSLLTRQAQYLLLHQATINKFTVLGEKPGKVTLRPADNAVWIKELEIFESLNVINKPVNRARYKIEHYSDTKSNLKVKAFTTTDDLSIRFLRVYYHLAPNRVKKIEAAYNESNSLYHSTRMLTMEFEEVRDTSVLTSYSILGGQKMFLDDTVRYDIKGIVNLGN